jgi:fumarate reductase flavoprotein subunit
MFSAMKGAAWDVQYVAGHETGSDFVLVKSLNLSENGLRQSLIYRGVSMKKVCLVLAMFFAMVVLGGVADQTFGAKAKQKPKQIQKKVQKQARKQPQKPSCTRCHTDIKEALPEKHRIVKGDGIIECLSCHKPVTDGEAKPDPFVARLHKAHASTLECGECHDWTPGKSFTVMGQKKSLGAFSREDMETIRKTTISWADSSNTDALHARKNVTCSACHEKKLIPDDTEARENQRCVACHGSLEKVAAKNKAHINPHKSHLGEISCTACHHAHASSRPYCASCHAFPMKIPGATQETAQKAAPKTGAVVPTVAVPKNVQFEKTDVVVIGSGAAGLTAAITARDMGAKVIVVEKQPVTGGNSMLAAGGMNAADTQFQRAKGIKDSPELMQKDTMAGGKNQSDPELVTVLAKNSAGSVEWLTKLGADLSDIGRLGGASVDRAHRPSGGTAVGATIVNTLRRNALERHIDVRVNSKAVKILEDKTGRVTGVLVEGVHRKLYGIYAGAVVNAAGGFSANPEKVAFYRPGYAGMTTSNQPGATGDGMDLGAQAGGQLRDMKEIQIHPSVAVGSRILITEAVRGNGAIMVNREGKRFVNEITTRDAASAAVLAQTGKTAFLVFDEGIRKSLKQIEGYFHLELVKEGETIQALAEKIRVPPESLAATIASYNKSYESKMDSEFKRPNMPRPVKTPKFYAIEIAPGIHYTMGGLKINTEARVIGKDGKPIHGFFAAGEVTGGVHGANRLGGNSISETITFGRIAGANAAKAAKQSTGMKRPQQTRVKN